MAQVKKLSQSELDGVSYRRIPTWQIAIGQLHSGCAMAFYVLMGSGSGTNQKIFIKTHDFAPLLHYLLLFYRKQKQKSIVCRDANS